jgi:cob(I)alamin adenosyltransferase
MPARAYPVKRGASTPGQAREIRKNKRLIFAASLLTAADAIGCFTQSGRDVLVLDSVVAWKDDVDLGLRRLDWQAHGSTKSMKIYTRKGDAGQTSIWGGRRVSKDAIRIEAIGAVDECNAAIGLAAAYELPEIVANVLITVQESLFTVNCELMAPDETGAGANLPRLTKEDVTYLETALDDIDELLPELKNFIHPGGTVEGAALHVARAACRRAERRVTTLRRSEPVSDEVAAYLNRLADLLFVLARYVNHRADVPDARWDRHAWQRSRAPGRASTSP